MSTKAPKAEITYDSTIELARKALYLWGGPDHQEMAARFGEAVEKWLKDNKAVSNLEPEQAITLYRMIKRLLVDDVAVEFYRLLSPDQIAWNTKHPLRKPENAFQVIGALQGSKGDDRVYAFHQAVWDHLKSDFTKAILVPSIEEIQQRIKIFVVACEVCTPQMIEAIYQKFFQDMDPKPDLSNAQSPVTSANVAKAVCYRHMKGDKLTPKWQARLIEMGALQADSIENEIEHFISLKLKQGGRPSEFIPAEQILSLIKYWKSTQPEESHSKKLREFLSKAIETGRVDLARKLAADPAIGEFQPTYIQSEVQEALNGNFPERAKILIEVFGKEAIGEKTLYLAYEKVDPFDPELIEKLRNHDANLHPDDISPLLIGLCSSNKIEQVKSLWDDGRFQRVKGESLRENAGIETLNDAFHHVLQVHQSFEGDRMGMLLALRKNRAEVPAGKPLSPENKRIIIEARKIGPIKSG